MSFDLPANLERELERYARAAHISPTEAAVKLIRTGLKDKVADATPNKFGQLGRPEEAIEAYDALINMPDASPDQRAAALLNKGLAFGQLGRLEEAIEAYTALMELPNTHNDQLDSATDAEVVAFQDAFPGLKQLDDVTDEQWDQVLKSARRMSREGLSGRG